METKKIYTQGAEFSPYVDGVTKIVSENMTEDIVEGMAVFVLTGKIGANASFAYKEFNVKAGAKIVATAKFHPSIIAIAKKKNDGKYDALATGQGFVLNERVEATATEDMTIAVSFYVTASRSIEINTQMVESNEKNIEILQSKMNDVALNDVCYGYLFDKVAVIGDSLSCGTLDAVTGTDGHVAGGSFGCSWLTCLAKRWGSSLRQHYARGGASCYTWLGDNNYGLGLMLKDTNVYDVYFIAMGHNDAGQYDAGTVNDSPVDVTVDADNNVTFNPALSTVTFLSMYKKIANEIRTKAPNALIFFVSTDVKDDNVNNSIGHQNYHIKLLADWYRTQGDNKVFFINYSDISGVTTSTTGYGTGGHFSTFGYVYIAKCINDCINKCIAQYMSTNALLVWGNYTESYRTTRNDKTTSGGYLTHL